MDWTLSTHKDTGGAVVRDRETGVIVADCSYEARDTFTPEEQEKHAKLMAVAPELLRMLRLVFELSTRNSYEDYAGTVKELCSLAFIKAGGRYTAAPWTVGDLVEDDYEPRHVEIKGADGVKIIAKAFYGRTDEECVYNAHLMAASTELLEACWASVRSLGEVYGMTDGEVELLKMLQKAINKAEGK